MQDYPSNTSCVGSPQAKCGPQGMNFGISDPEVANGIQDVAHNKNPIT